MIMKEIWKDIENYEGMYQVSNLGRVKSLTRYSKHRGNPMLVKEKILKSCVGGVGYLTVALHKNNSQKSKNVHKLVAVAFLNHKPCGYKLVVNHKNFNRLDNNVSNLEIVTVRENTNQKHIKSSSKYTGVCWDKNANKWVCRIRINGKRKYLGLFEDEKEASMAYENYKTKTILK